MTPEEKMEIGGPNKGQVDERKAKHEELIKYTPQIRPCAQLKKDEVAFLSKISEQGFLGLLDIYKKPLLKKSDLSNPLLTTYIEISKTPIISQLDFSEFTIEKKPAETEVNEKISSVCENLETYFNNQLTKELFITASVNQSKFAAFLKSKQCNDNSDPSNVIEQHLARYHLTLRAIIETNEKEKILSKDTEKKIMATIAKITAFTTTINNTKRLVDFGYSPQQIILFSSEEEKINTLANKITTPNDSEGIYALLKENPISEITSIISKQQPEKIAETLRKLHTEAVGHLRTMLKHEQYLDLAKKLKMDFYLNQIENPSLKKAISSTLENDKNITFHATGITSRIRAKFSSGIHASTTSSLISKLNIAQENYSNKNSTIKQKAEAEKDIKEYLSQLGLKTHAEDIIKTINEPSSNPSKKTTPIDQSAASFIQPQALHTPQPLPSDEALKQPKDTLITSTKLSTDQKPLPPSNTPNSSSGVKSLIAKFSNPQNTKTGTLNWQKTLEPTPTKTGPTWSKPAEVKPTKQPTPPSSTHNRS